MPLPHPYSKLLSFLLVLLSVSPKRERVHCHLLWVIHWPCISTQWWAVRDRKAFTAGKLASLWKGLTTTFISLTSAVPWLTAFEEYSKLYCWECLIFATDRLGVWSHRGFTNLSWQHRDTKAQLDTYKQRCFGNVFGKLVWIYSLINKCAGKRSSTMFFARNTTGQTGLSALASMAIEQDLELKHSDNLNNRVIIYQLFLRKERSMNFVYK